MGIGKMLAFAGLGVAAVAAAPFTGGGSILAATTLGSSLAGAGAVAAAVGAGTAGAVAGKILDDNERHEKEEMEEHIAELNQKAEKLEKGFKEAIKKFHGDKEYFNYIIAMTAIGISMANVDGEIDESERLELEEFIGGIAQSNYPDHVKSKIEELYQNPPNINTALLFLEKVDPSNYDSLRDMLELIMEADGTIHKKEKTFLQIFDSNTQMIEYSPEKNDNEKQVLQEMQRKMVA